jgi:outer membrane immunogenic protein
MDVRENGQSGSGSQHLRTRFGPFWGTIRARAGFVWDRALIFATGGVAFARLDNVSHNTITGHTASSSDVQTGWVAGGGVEYAFADNITGKLEYLHMDFGRYDGLGSSHGRVSFDNTVNVIRAGIAYRF